MRSQLLLCVLHGVQEHADGHPWMHSAAKERLLKSARYKSHTEFTVHSKLHTGRPTQPRGASEAARSVAWRREHGVPSLWV